MSPKSTYWLPTERSPWAVIYYDEMRGYWRYLGMRETRKEARALAKFTRGQYPSGHLLHRTAASVRVVRAWIPLK
jgi:hypothetical protein